MKYQFVSSGGYLCIDALRPVEGEPLSALRPADGEPRLLLRSFTIFHKSSRFRSRSWQAFKDLRLSLKKARSEVTKLWTEWDSGVWGIFIRISFFFSFFTFEHRKREHASDLRAHVNLFSKQFQIVSLKLSPHKIGLLRITPAPEMKKGEWTWVLELTEMLRFYPVPVDFVFGAFDKGS